ncbi:MAG: helix-turn-helix domain-containing protein, partial [Bacteroidales bacterium]|nr:helix-turn-helix domain-containing protein [Bacteroidales bacterium]
SKRSAAEWINEFAITEAKMLLRFSDMSVQQVAEKLNFSSQSAFGKYFKQYVGVSPKVFRREN